MENDFTDTDEGFEELEDLTEPAELPETETIEESIAAAFEEVDAKAAEEKPVVAKAEEAKPEESSLTKAARELAGAKKKGRGPKQTVEGEALDVPARQARAPKEPKQDTEAYTPPQRMPVEQKERFLKYPKDMQKQILSDYQEWEGGYTKAIQDARREQSQHAEVNGVINHYASRWGAGGIAPVAAIREIAGLYDLIVTRGPEGIAALMHKTGTTPEMLNAHLQGKTVTPPGQNGYNPGQQNYNSQGQQQNKQLTRAEIAQIYREEVQAQQSQARVSTEFGALEKIRNEVAGDRYAFPELWDRNNAAGNYFNAEYARRMQPLVDSAEKTHPGLSYEERCRKAIQTLRHFDGTQTGSPSLSGQRLTPQQEIQKVRQASVSVRGRGNASVSTERPQKGESIEDSLRAVWGTNGTY